MYKYILLIILAFLFAELFASMVTPYKGTTNTIKGISSLLGAIVTWWLFKNSFKEKK